MSSTERSSSRAMFRGSPPRRRGPMDGIPACAGMTIGQRKSQPRRGLASCWACCVDYIVAQALSAQLAKRRNAVVEPREPGVFTRPHGRALAAVSRLAAQLPGAFVDHDARGAAVESALSQVGDVVLDPHGTAAEFRLAIEIHGAQVAAVAALVPRLAR